MGRSRRGERLGSALVSVAKYCPAQSAEEPGETFEEEGNAGRRSAHYRLRAAEDRELDSEREDRGAKRRVESVATEDFPDGDHVESYPRKIPILRPPERQKGRSAFRVDERADQGQREVVQDENLAR